VIRALSLAAVVACGPIPPPAPDPDQPPPPALGTEKPLPGLDRTWSQLDKVAKVRVMKDWVLPMGRDMFVGYNRDRYESFACTTCHGDRANRGEYAMPNPQLLPLGFGPDSGYAELVARRPELVAFMKTKLSPAMADVLGKSQWAEDNPDGFGCWSCHPKTDKIPRSLIAPEH